MRELSVENIADIIRKELPIGKGMGIYVDGLMEDIYSKLMMDIFGNNRVPDDTKPPDFSGEYLYDSFVRDGYANRVVGGVDIVNLPYKTGDYTRYALDNDLIRLPTKEIELLFRYLHEHADEIISLMPIGHSEWLVQRLIAYPQLSATYGRWYKEKRSFFVNDPYVVHRIENEVAMGMEDIDGVIATYAVGSSIVVRGNKTSNLIAHIRRYAKHIAVSSQTVSYVSSTYSAYETEGGRKYVGVGIRKLTPDNEREMENAKRAIKITKVKEICEGTI